MNTMLFTVPARSPALGEGSLAVVRVLQDPPGVVRISVESSLVYDLPGQCTPPTTKRTWKPGLLVCVEILFLLI